MTGWVLLILAAVYLPLLVGIGGSLYRIASAVEAQNKHYGVGGEKA